MSVRDIETVRAISGDELEARELPLVIAGGARDLPAVARWSPLYLADLLGELELAFKLSATGDHPNFHAATLAEQFARGRAPVRELLAAMTTGPREERARRLFTGDEEPLVQVRDGATRTSAGLAPLMADVALPAQIPPERLYTIWAWFSGPGVRTWLHYDNNGCHNLNAQITGTKTCRLFAPSELGRLDPFPLGGANPAHNCSRLDVATADLSGVSELRARLTPGDLLFIPAWWLHSFEHDGDFNSNVNWWWKPAQPIDCTVARRQQLLDLVAIAGLKPAPGSPEAALLGRLDAAAIAP